MKERLKKLVPYLIAIVGFIAAGYAYAPYTLSGKVVNQSDISSWRGMSHEIVDWNESHPDDPTYWTNSMFSGMPANTISIKYKGDLTQYIYDLLFIGQRPASYLIISMVGAFLLFLAFGVNIWLAILGAIAISFCSYNMQIIQVGHNTKMIAIAFMPWVLASLVYAYRKRWLLGALLFGLTLSFQVKANHPQISYYLAIIILGFVIWQLCSAIRSKTFGKFLKTSVAVLVAGLLGIGANVNHLWPTYEYGQQSMRGGSELASENTEGNDAAQKSKGLDLQYATQWSYGIEETPNIMIPNFNGGASAGELSTSSETYKVLSQGYSGADQIIKQLPLYWGPQPFTAGPMYIGAICIFLFILGLFVVKNGARWWLLVVSLLAIVLSWGYHFMAPTEFFFNHVPMYNKFRTVSMILVILQITIPVLSVLAVNEIFKEDSQDKALVAKNKKGVLWAAIITGGFCLLFAVIPSLAGSFTGVNDSMLPKDIAQSLEADRAGLLSSDALRSLIFILIAAAAIWLGMTKKMKTAYVYIVLIVLVLIDLWGIDKRYLNSSHFVTDKEFTAPLNKRAVDELILSTDKDLSYRVLDLSSDPFNNAYPSYWHKTIGGYSPAKLQRYQDLIERNISPEANALISDLNNSGATTITQANDALGYYKVLSMLNTRYIILGAEQPPLVNNKALGNCWFVDSLVNVTNANEEISELANIDPANTAVINDNGIGILLVALAAGLGDSTSVADETASPRNIELTEYAPNRLKYRYKADSPQVAVFSEVYYSPGWTAKFTGELDGEKVKDEELDIVRANYILRALFLPKGEGEIEFYYLPQSIVKGAWISLICSGLLLLLLAVYCIYRIKVGGCICRKSAA